MGKRLPCSTEFEVTDCKTILLIKTLQCSLFYILLNRPRGTADGQHDTDGQYFDFVHIIMRFMVSLTRGILRQM